MFSWNGKKILYLTNATEKERITKEGSPTWTGVVTTHFLGLAEVQAVSGKMIAQEILPIIRWNKVMCHIIYPIH